jgi:hypothetical protein
MKPNSVLLVVDSFGSLIGVSSAKSSGKAQATDAAVIQDAAVYERLALSLTSKKVDVSVLYIPDSKLASAADEKQFASVQSAYGRLGVRLFRSVVMTTDCRNI